MKLKIEERIKIRDIFVRKTAGMSPTNLSQVLCLDRTLIYLYKKKDRIPTEKTALKLKAWLDNENRGN